MHIHGADVTAVFIGPDGIEQCLPGIDPVGIVHEIFNHIEFFRGQIHQCTGAISVPGIQIQCDGTDGQLVDGCCSIAAVGTGPAEQGTDSGS